MRKATCRLGASSRHRSQGGSARARREDLTGEEVPPEPHPAYGKDRSSRRSSHEAPDDVFGRYETGGPASPEGFEQQGCRDEDGPYGDGDGSHRHRQSHQPATSQAANTSARVTPCPVKSTSSELSVGC